MQRESEVVDYIKQIKNSTLAEERKTRLVAKKELLCKILETTKATGYINAAAGYFNAGRREQVLEIAEKAAYPQFKKAAEQVLKKIE